MEFESTLQKASEKHEKHLKEAITEGYDRKPTDEVFKLIMSSNTSMACMRSRALYIAKTVQPSITEADLKIASDMMCAMASQLVLNLIEEGLISVNRK